MNHRHLNLIHHLNYCNISRMMGLTQPSVLEILLTPYGSSAVKQTKAAAIPRPPSSRMLTLTPSLSSSTLPTQPLQPEDISTSLPNPMLTKTNRLTSLLPPNVVLPTSSLTIIGIYRVMLLKSLEVTLVNAEKHLPQTGTLHSPSALLGGFPKLIGESKNVLWIVLCASLLFCKNVLHCCVHFIPFRLHISSTMTLHAPLPLLLRST